MSPEEVNPLTHTRGESLCGNGDYDGEARGAAGRGCESLTGEK